MVQAATKSSTNLSAASSLAYTSANALSCEWLPKIKSTDDAIHRGRPSAVPSKKWSQTSDASHVVPMSKRLTKNALFNRPGVSVSVPIFIGPWLVPKARMPPTRTVISGAVSVS